MAEMSGVSILQHEIEKAKDKLKDVNENIKKLTGRDPEDLRSVKSRQQEARGRGRLFTLARRGIMPAESPGGPPAKKRMMAGAFARLGPMIGRRREREDSGDEDEPPNKLTVHSSVVATPKEVRSRKECLQEQSNDKEGLQRNRRMFGLLLGTLQKFKTEARAQDEKVQQRRMIEKKLEEDAEREKEHYRQETKLLIEESQLEQAKISRLQQKMELVNEHEALAAETRKLQNFLCTRAKPRIFWLPKALNSAAESKLKESKKVVEKMLKDKQEALEREINEVMEREQQREERIRMRLRQDANLLDKENNSKSGRTGTDGGSRQSRDKKGSSGAHKEAKKKSVEMQYDDEEEEMEEEDEVTRIELGDREVAGGDKGKRGEEGKAKELTVNEKPEEGKKVESDKGGYDDGNNTDVDYNDDEMASEGEMPQHKSSLGEGEMLVVGESSVMTSKEQRKEEGGEDRWKEVALIQSTDQASVADANAELFSSGALQRTVEEGVVEEAANE
ncbi:hypothetical protein C0Q70_13430 [Pomacea canaliculata]|uniref:Pinin n=1 Tax=Pomacea canaliculata TaxID=400727 RepID=A0A2T7NX75_POMCA|nr:pinin-like [Pomacea canaliculata]PVD25770.1 hypothetical protein C0Q70_13430 [Pomacea canaliculata]